MTIRNCAYAFFSLLAAAGCDGRSSVDRRGTALAGLVCPGGGDYCGADGVAGGDVDTLYHCPGAGQAPSSADACANGCQVMPDGVPDYCRPAAGPVCPGRGDYCGSDGVVGGDPDTLYHCPGMDQAPSSSDHCDNGCQVMPPGVQDYCIVPQPTVCGKLSGQALLEETAGFRSLRAICPRVIKWMYGSNAVDWNALTTFKASCPASRTILRIWYPQQYYPTGQDLWDRQYAFLAGVSPSQKASVDYLESDNEGEAGHGFVNPADFNAFLLGWIDRAQAAGYHPLIGNIPVGNPGGVIGDCSGDAIRAFGGIIPAIQAAAQAGGGWAYHSYTFSLATDVGTQQYWTLRYRRYHDCYASEIGSVPVILTEVGYGHMGGGGPGDGWIGHISADQYIAWLAWFQQQIGQDPYVIGGTLFAYGQAAGWATFQHDPIEPRLESLIQTCH